MWTWLTIAFMARLLLASQEVDFRVNNGEQQVVQDLGEGDSLEKLSQGTIKPMIKSNSQCKNENIFQDTGGFENEIYDRMREISVLEEMNPSIKNTDDQRGKRLTKNIGYSSPPLIDSWISLMNLENKALTPIQSHPNPWQEIKKSRAFSPWGGKRVAMYGQGSKVRRPIRVPFNSWGGKRYDKMLSPGIYGVEKHPKFSSWGGKRSWDIGEEENEFENKIEKRTKFNAWGGKRSKNGERDEEEIKRTRFNAWGGKRSGIIEKKTPEEVIAKKSVFNAWGGKRLIESETGRGRKIDQLKENEVSLPYNEKGVKFGSWNKNEDVLNLPHREMIETEDNNLEEDGTHEIFFENETMELPERRGGGNDLQKSLFNPWGGKKRSNNDRDKIEGNLQNLMSPESADFQRHYQQGRFWPWGG